MDGMGSVDGIMAEDDGTGDDDADGHGYDDQLRCAIAAAQEAAEWRAAAVTAAMGLDAAEGRLGFIARHLAAQDDGRAPAEAPRREGKLSAAQQVELGVAELREARERVLALRHGPHERQLLDPSDWQHRSPRVCD